MVKKVFITILLSLFLGIGYVNAAEKCSYSDKAKLNSEAANIKVTYEIGSYNETDIHISSNYYFDISILNLSDDFYMEIANNHDNDVDRIYSSKDGENHFYWRDIKELTTLTFVVYSTSSSKCPGEKIRTIRLSLPKYNEYSDYTLCEGREKSDLCQKFVTFKDVNVSQFKEQVEKIKPVDPENPEPEEKTSIIKIILDFIIMYKWPFIALVVIVLATIVIISIKKRKRRVL